MDPTQINNNDVTIVTSNMPRPQAITSALPLPKALSMPTMKAIADTGATSIFVMARTLKKNVQLATNPLSINLPNGVIICSTHVCNIDMYRGYQ